MPKYIVSYQLPYFHCVSVGVEADGEEQAIEKAKRAFDEGSFWDDTRDMPLLYDDFIEEKDGILEFTAEETIQFPRRGNSVIAMKKDFLADAMEDALRGLVEWARKTGGWEAPAWRKAERLLEQLDGIQREQEEV